VGEVFIVVDTATDPRIDADTCGALGVRSCIMVPLVREGRCRFLLGIVDNRPRAWRDDEIELMRDLANRAWARLERARGEHALRESEAWLAGQKEAFQAAVNGAPLETSLGVLIRTAIEQMGSDLRCAFYITNEAGTALHHVAGMSDAYAECVDGFRVAADSLACGLAVYTARPVITVDVNSEPRWQPWRWLATKYEYRGCWSFPIETSSGKVVGTLAMYFRTPRDASPRDFEFAAVLTRAAAMIISRSQEIGVRAQVEVALRSSLAEREALLKELHHRVKNNLHVIIGLLEMQARQARDSHTVASLGQARDRIAAIAAIHELLYQSGSFSVVDLTSYARRLVAHIAALYQERSSAKVAVVGTVVVADLARAVPFGLLLNELVSNACKHAFPAGTGGELTVALDEDEQAIVLRVSDTGVGLPERLDYQNSGTLGLSLVHMLAKQLGGSVSFESGIGTTVQVALPKTYQVA
jgi:two-component sensor histidine kinase